MKHIHAENMALYAHDAIETEWPWGRWECAAHGEVTPWKACSTHPNWLPDMRYRRKPRAININGHEVPEPVREPLKDRQEYFMPDFTDNDYHMECSWTDHELDHLRLRNGHIHLTKEAAQAHAKALLSFTEKQS